MVQTLLFILVFTFLPFSAYATISGMNLLGKGEVYYLGLIKVYDAALYAESNKSGLVLDGKTSLCLQLTYDVSLSVKDFVLGAETVLNRQHPPEEIARFQREIDMLHTAYRDVTKGDSYFLCYDARQQKTILRLNTTELISVSSPLFAKLYFGIWLGAEKPIDERLREKLLAQEKER